MTKVSSTYLNHSLGVVAVLRAFLLKRSMYKLATIGLNRDPIYLFTELALKGKVNIV